MEDNIPHPKTMMKKRRGFLLDNSKVLEVESV